MRLPRRRRAVRLVVELAGLPEPRAARSIVLAMLRLVVKKFQELLASRALVQLCIGESNLEVYGSLKSLATVLATLVSAGRFFPPRS